MLGTVTPVSGATLLNPIRPISLSTLAAALTWLRYDVTGCSVNCMHTAERTSLSPAASAIMSDTEPTQCPSACTLPAPVMLRTSATAWGQSVVATSSSENAVRDEGRSMLAR